MYYYLENFNFDSSVVGITDGMDQLDLVDNTSLSSDFIFQNLINLDGRQELGRIQLDKTQAHLEFKLRAKAKITDLMTFSELLNQCDFVVSDKLLESLLIAKYDSLFHYPVEILQKKERYSGYSLVQIQPIDLSDIDFKRSEFGMAKVPIRDIHEIVRFEDSDSFVSSSMSIFNSIIPYNLEFKSNYKGAKELLKVPYLGVVVSAELKDKISKNQFSNVRFRGMVK